MKKLAVLFLVVLLFLMGFMSYAWFYCIYFRIMEGLPFNTYSTQMLALFFCQGSFFVLFVLLTRTLKK
jgi:hypothetical protein